VVGSFSEAICEGGAFVVAGVVDGRRHEVRGEGRAGPIGPEFMGKAKVHGATAFRAQESHGCLSCNLQDLRS